MKPNYEYSLNSITGMKELAAKVSVALKNIFDIFTNNVTFSENMLCTIVQGVVLQNSVELGISHNLGKIPQGYLIINQSAGAFIYRGSGIWNDRQIYLISSADVVADIIILGG